MPASIWAQPANDECTSATVLTLATPTACPTGSTSGFNQGATTTLTNQSNINATPSAPYPYLSTCPINISNTPRDVWYSFVATGFQTTISVTNGTGTLTNPVISMWGGTCNSYLGLGCSSGSGGTATLTVYQTIIGRTYYIQVAGLDSTQRGTFTLNVACANNCAGCLLQSYITPSPMPSNGTYAPGQTVQFCYTVTNWDQGNANWLHGVAITYGAGWDPASLVITGTPASCTTGGGAYWQYYPGGQTSSNTGNYFGPGFYYETTAGSTSGILDSDPGNNYGDQNAGLGTCSPTFCIQLTAFSTDTPGSDLSVHFTSSGDGESGSWSSLACGIDPTVSFNNVSSCTPPRMKSLTAACNQSNGADTAKIPGRYFGPYVFHWSNGVIDSTADSISVISNLAPGVYTVTVTNAQGCVAVNRDTVKSESRPHGGPDQYVSCPSSVDSVVMAGVGQGIWTAMTGNPASVLIHDPDSSNTTISGFSVSGTYNFIWSVGACSDTVSIIVSSRPDAGPDTTTCVNATATMNAVGTGTWTAVPTNPAATTIQNPTDPHTTITGFSIGGTYQFVWSVASCHDTALVIVPVFSVSAVGDTSLCKYQTTTISASAMPTAMGPFIYQWLNSGLVQSPNAATTVINPLQNTTDFVVRVTASNGCFLFDTVHVLMNGVAPRISIMPSAVDVCPGDIVTLNPTVIVANLVNCGTVVDTTPDNSVLSIGSVGNSVNFTTDVTSPYNAGYRKAKFQYLITAAEMNAAGLSSGAITDLSFYVSQLNSTAGYDSLSISMGCTNQTTLSGSFSNSLLEVLPPSQSFPNLGWSPHPFLHYFNWDGVSNLIVQVCYSLTTTGTSDFVAYNTTSGNTVAYSRSNGSGNGCNITAVPTFSNNRPNMRFGIAAPNVLHYQWSPPTGDCDTCATVSLTVNQDSTYHLTVDDNGCVNDSSVRVTINPYLATHLSPRDTSLCNGADTVQLHLSLANPPSSVCLPDYTVTSIPYNSISGLATSIPTSSYVGAFGGTSTDDGTAGPFNMNFSFPFYCNNYTQVWVNTNAWISLANPYPATTGSLQYVAQTFPPTAAFRNPLHEIALAVGDYAVSSAGQVSYFLTGTAPNRIFVVKYNALPRLSNSSQTVTGEIHLYETSGIIEIMLQSCSYSGTNHTTGIKDDTNVGIAAPGRNSQQYTITSPEGWRFTPHNGPTAFIQNVLWTPNGGTLNNDTIVNPVATPTATTTYVADIDIAINHFTTPEVCHVRDSAIVRIGNFPHSVSATPALACVGSSSQLSFNTADSVVSYVWTPGPPALSNSTIRNPVATVYDTLTFYVTATDTSHCSVRDSVTVYTYPVLHPSLGRDTTICYTDSVILSLPGSYASYEWFMPGAAAPVATTPTLAAQPRSAYVLRLQDATTGCYFYTDTLQVDSFSHPELPVTASGPLAFCTGGNVVLQSDPLYPNPVWSNGSTQQVIPVTDSGYYYYTALDAHNCLRHSDTAKVTVNPPPAILYQQLKPVICSSESDTIIISTIPPGVPATWSTGGTTVATGDTFITATPGSYQITASQGCPTDSFFTLRVSAAPVLDTLRDTSVCSCTPGYVITANATSALTPVSYQWSNGSMADTASVDVLGASSYSVTVTDAGGCTATASVNVNINCFEVHAVAPVDTIIRGLSFGLADSPGHTGPVSYTWTPSDSLSNPYSASTKGIAFGTQSVDTFYLMAYDSSTGCSATSSVMIYIVDRGGIAMANAFTPNGDGHNDRMYPVVADGSTVTQFRIYNRWGQTVYDNAKAPGWDGTYHGVLQGFETYTYFLTYESTDPQDASKKVTKSIEGSFQLLR